MLCASVAIPALDDRLPEENMQSPSMQEFLYSHTPENNLNPTAEISHLDRTRDDWREPGWFLKHEKDELAGYLFDSDLLREGSD